MERSALMLIKLDEDKDVYFPGEVIVGKIELKILKQICIEKLSICFRGKSVVSWEDTEIDEDNETHHYARFAEDDICHRSINLFKRESKESCTPRPNYLPATHERGWYTYPFRIKIGKGFFPSSFECEFGAVRYWLKGKVIEKGCEQTVEKMVTVLERIYVDRESDQNNLSSDSTLCQLDSNSGSGFLSADIDYESYCPGEDIIVKCYAQQSSSNKPLTGIKATLTQTVKLTDNESRTKKVQYEISSIEDNAFGISNEKFWQNQRLSIPPISASIKCGAIISVSFTVTIILTISEGYDLSFRIPIIIGTLPRKVTREFGIKKTSAACIPLFRTVTTGVKTFQSNCIIPQFSSTLDFLPYSCFIENGQSLITEQTTITREVPSKSKLTNTNSEEATHSFQSEDEGNYDDGSCTNSFSEDSNAEEKVRKASQCSQSTSSDLEDGFDERSIQKRERSISHIYIRPKQRSVSIL